MQKEKNEFLLFLIVKPGLEDLALRELEEVSATMQLRFKLMPPKAIKVLKAEGIELWVLEKQWLCIIEFLKIPSRVLLRLTEFNARSIPELKRRLERFFKSESLLFDQIKISAKSCAVNNEKKILTLLNECKEDFKKQGFESKNLWLRGFKDHFVISEDLTGEHLHFRGYRKSQAEAPLRENYAAALATYFLKDLNLNFLKACTFLDPFCGSGTLLFELATLFLPVNSFTKRDFNYQKDRVLANTVLKEINNSQEWKDYIIGENFIGSDISPKAIEASLNNYKNLPVLHNRFKFILKNQNDLSVDEVYRGADFLDNKKLFIISNLPYGERIHYAKNQKPADGTNQKSERINLESIITSLLERFKPTRCGFLISEKQFRDLKPFVNTIKEKKVFEWVEPLRFSNNSIPVVFIMLIKKDLN